VGRLFGASTRRLLDELRYRNPAGATPGELTVTWFGTTCELISDGETALLVDPFVTRTAGLLALAANRRVLRPDPAQYARWIAPRARGVPIRAMPVTHTHFDHILDAGVVGARTGAVLLGSRSSVVAGRSLGLPEEQARVAGRGGPHRFGAFTVTFLPSRHSGGGKPAGEIDSPVAVPARFRDLRQGGTFSVLIEHPAGTLLCHHSAGYVPGALAGRRADTVFLSAASVPADREAYLRETVDAVGARRVFLVHWDDFTRPLDAPLRPIPLAVDLAGFATDLRRLRPRLALHTLPLGEAQLVAPP
jgi:L-ascorbate metabolism protein UlaG (beta-lactamase superfamily)